MKKTREDAALNDVGPAIRKMRLASKEKISQQDLAGRLAARGIWLDRSAISRIENQERGILDYELIAIANCLKVSPTDLLPKS
ncbi:MAG: helix-turn-helix transcriptional regulator [Opitutales bacterium]|nr:helix-turn-helix transcriptional regulator [Opitutales bacterium]MCH8540962.1 helix-turn-helix domain-containing protein [Opitutales bacterium]